MAKYWIYLNDKVLGPYELEQLIRVPGFSRQSMVSMDNFSGQHGNWISPAEIPELARIFQKVEALHDAPIPNRPPPKQAKPKMPAKLTPVAPPVEEPSKFPWAWLSAILACLLIAGGLFLWNKTVQRQARAEERQNAKTLVETAPLPAASQYSTLRQYLQMKQISSRWEFERQPSSLYNVTVSWMPPEGAASRMPVYSFEVNLQAQTVRGLNTAGARLLAEGFPAAPVAKAASPAAPKKSPADTFPGAINDRRQAFEQGDFDTVWDSFSKRRKSEMSQGGINQTGFVRMQKLTYRLSPGLQQSIVKTKQDSDTARLVLLKQTQPKHPDIYIKQSWVWEDNAWKLDDEEKKMAVVSTPAAAAEPERLPRPHPPMLRHPPSPFPPAFLAFLTPNGNND